MPSPSSSAQEALIALGSRLREIRLHAELSGRDLAQLAGWHSSKVSKIEHGRQTPSAADIRIWCTGCSATDQAADLIASLRAAEGMFVEWHRLERNGLRFSQESVLSLWERTRRFRIYNPRIVPGPIQTTDYISAMLTGIRIRRDLRDDVEAAVQARVQNQIAACNGADRLAIVVEENVLRHPIGGTDSMAGQLGHLLTVSALPSVSLGVIPLGADRSHSWPVEGFWIFDEACVAVELVSGFLSVTRPTEIAMYAQVFGELASLAVYGARARALIAAAISALDA